MDGQTSTKYGVFHGSLLEQLEAHRSVRAKVERLRAERWLAWQRVMFLYETALEIKRGHTAS